MMRLADRVIFARGWRRFLVAFLAGAVGALSMPPFGFLPALALSLSPAVWLIDGAGKQSGASRLARIKAAALAGWFWGFGYFLAGLWWLGAAFLVEADQFAWALPLGVLGLPAALAAFPAFGFALARLMWTPDALRILTFAAALTASEGLRGHLFTGFPWNAPGMALGQNLYLMQGASLVGLYGLTLIAIGIGAAPAILFTERGLRARLVPPGLALATLAALAAFGFWRVPSAPVENVDGVRLRLMQPNLPQDAKFNPRNRDAILRHYLTLSASPGPNGETLDEATHIVWPESAFPFLLHRDPGALSQIAGLLSGKRILVTGAARMDPPLPGETVGPFFNAIQVIDGRGAIIGTYDKVHLVPFGEYVPKVFDSLIRALGLRQFVHIPGGFTPAEVRTGLAVPGLPPMAATICYEAIFPGEVLPPGPRPHLILNVTNDAWFGRTPGPYQHFAQARLRAVEEGLPLVRAANTGISAVVDPYGRIMGQLPLGIEGILSSRLPVGVSETFYKKIGSFPLTAMLVICLMGLAVSRVQRFSFH